MTWKFLDKSQVSMYPSLVAKIISLSIYCKQEISTLLETNSGWKSCSSSVFGASIDSGFFLDFDSSSSLSFSSGSEFDTLFLGKM